MPYIMQINLNFSSNMLKHGAIDMDIFLIVSKGHSALAKICNGKIDMSSFTMQNSDMSFTVSFEVFSDYTKFQNLSQSLAVIGSELSNETKEDIHNILSAYLDLKIGSVEIGRCNMEKSNQKRKFFFTLFQRCCS